MMTSSVEKVETLRFLFLGIGLAPEVALEFLEELPVPLFEATTFAELKLEAELLIIAGSLLKVGDWRERETSAGGG